MGISNGSYTRFEGGQGSNRRTAQSPLSDRQPEISVPGEWVVRSRDPLQRDEKEDIPSGEEPKGVKRMMEEGVNQVAAWAATLEMAATAKDGPTGSPLEAVSACYCLWARS